MVSPSHKWQLHEKWVLDLLTHPTDAMDGSLSELDKVCGYCCFIEPGPSLTDP